MTYVLCFLGLELDTNKMEVRIPLVKVEEVISKTTTMLEKRRTTLRDMQLLIGSLKFCCRAIPTGRSFCRRLITATCGLSRPGHHMHVTKNIKKDWKRGLPFSNTIMVSPFSPSAISFQTLTNNCFRIVLEEKVREWEFTTKATGAFSVGHRPGILRG